MALNRSSVEQAVDTRITNFLNQLQSHGTGGSPLVFIKPTEGSAEALIVFLSVEAVAIGLHIVMERSLGQRVKVLPHGFAGSQELCARWESSAGSRSGCSTFPNRELLLLLRRESIGEPPGGRAEGFKLSRKRSVVEIVGRVRPQARPRDGGIAP